ncbi:MAG: glycosyltransferase family 39 protein [Segetibacter sp.]|nr:glycosyltransferase family 39 protein [Segetibacter sp.]
MLLFKLGTAPIYILDEAKNAQCAREMLQRNDWIVPTFNQELRTDKPVLHYYFMMAAYKIFGVNEMAARFFSAGLGILTVVITFFFSKRFTDPLTAFCSALVLTASTHFLFEFRLSVPDPYLIFFITTGLFTAYTYLQENKFLYLLIAAISFALATLAKGPVALALPGLCLLTWIFIKRKWNLVFTWKILVAVALIAVITLPWYLAVHKATNGEWTRGFFIDHNLNRFSDPQEGHGGIFLVTILFVLIGLLPFATYLGEVFKKSKSVFTPDLVKFSGIVVIAFVTFFSISSTKLPNYPMPCYPFAAIILGHYLRGYITGLGNDKKYPIYILLALLVVIPFAAHHALSHEIEAAHLKYIPLFSLAGFIAALTVMFSWKKWSNYSRVISICIVWSVFNTIILHFVYPAIYQQNPVAKTLNIVHKYQEVYAYKIYNPGYNFYLNKPVKRFSNTAELGKALRANPSAIIITRKDNAADLSALNLLKVAEHHDLFESPTTALYVAR